MCAEIMINFAVVLKKSSLPLSILERLQHPASSVLVVPSASLRGRLKRVLWVQIWRLSKQEYFKSPF